MKVKLIYIRQDGRQHATAEYESAQRSFAGVLAEVRGNRIRQGKSPGLSGRADCYHIVVESYGQRALVRATASRR
jgi:hypothetical protein